MTAVDCTDAKGKGMCSGATACDLSVPMSYGYKDIKAVCDQTTDGGGWTVFNLDLIESVLSYTTKFIVDFWRKPR